MLISATVGVIKEEDTNAVVLTTSQNRQAVLSTPGVVNTTEASCLASPAPGKTVKAEERVEASSAVKMGKRTKRLRTVPDNPTLDREEKKVSIIQEVLFLPVFGEVMQFRVGVMVCLELKPRSQ